MQPGGVIALSGDGNPVLVILCAPLNEYEWYCHDGRASFDDGGLFLAELQCDVTRVCSDIFESAQRLVEIARLTVKLSPGS